MKKVVTLWLLLVAVGVSQPKQTPSNMFWRLSGGTLVPTSSQWRVGGQVNIGGVNFDSAGLAVFPLSQKKVIGRTGPRGFVVDSLFIVGRATANSDTVKFDIRYFTDITQSGTALLAAPDTIAGVTPNTTTGFRRGSFTNATIPANTFVSVAVTKRTGAWKEIVVVLQGHVP